MDENLFDHSAFFLAINGIPTETLSVRRFHCSNDGLSDHYHFHLSCISHSFYAASAWINQRATLSTAGNYRHGLISAIKCTGRLSDGFHYGLTLSSLLHPLLLRFNQRIFLNKKLSEIISQVLETASFINEYQILLQNNPVINYRVQYQQSDYDFLQSLLQQYDLQFAWKQDTHRVALIVTDQFSYFNQTSVSIESLYGIPITKMAELNYPDTIKVSTNNTSLQAGQLITLANQSYRIMNIAHEVQQDVADLAATNKLRYRADLTLFNPCDVGLRVAQPNLLNTAPLLTAKTETTGGVYPYIDDEGRYFTRLPFDISQSPPTQASPPEYLIQPHSNGMHFPVQPNTEMAVTHLYGDINQPILLGALANPSTPTSVTAENNSQYIYRSFGGNQLLIDDLAQHEKIQLSNPQQQNLIRLDATAGAPQILIQSQQGQINFSAKQDASIVTQSSHYQTTQQNHQILVNNQHQLTANQQLLQSGKSLGLSAKNNINLQTDEEDIDIEVKQQMNLTSKTVQLQSQNIQIESTNKTIQLYAKQNLHFQSESGLTLQSGSSNISANNSGLTIKTATLYVNAQKISCPQPIPPNSD